MTRSMQFSLALTIASGLLGQADSAAQVLRLTTTTDEAVAITTAHEIVLLGPAVAPAIVDALKALPGHDCTVQAIRLGDVLRRFGPGAAATFPRLIEWMKARPSEAPAVLPAALAFVPWQDQIDADSLLVIQRSREHVAAARILTPRGARRMAVNFTAAKADHIDRLRVRPPTLDEIRSRLKQGKRAERIVAVRELWAWLGRDPDAIGTDDRALASTAADRLLRRGLPASDRFDMARAILRLEPTGERANRARAHLALDHPVRTTRCELIRAVAEAGADDHIVVERVIAATRDRDRRVAGEAITALGLIGRESADARDRLEALATGDDRELSRRARAALRNLR